MKLILISSFVIISNLVFAQKITFYFDKEDKKVYDVDSAYYIREITPNEADDFYKVNEYYRNKVRKLEGVVSKYDPYLVYEGLVRRYFENGSKQEEVIYYKNKPLGEYKKYYKNGQLKEIQVYLDKRAETPGINPNQTIVKMMAWYDSAGVQKIKDGNGYLTETEYDWTTSGRYTNGLKDSIWKGENLKKNYSYIEKYEAGKFITGSVKIDGKESLYTEAEKQPEYPGGLYKFLNYVGKEYSYPAAAIRVGLSGRVIVNFVVEKDGSLTDFKIMRDIGYGTGEEAVRVLKSSKKWNPGLQHGIPVRVSYTLPISLVPPR